MPGHRVGHGQKAGLETPPTGFSWESYVLAFVEQWRGWVPLADELSRRTAGVEGVPIDLQAIEKGLRRLAKRGHRSGGQYGRWMVRYFGIPSSLARWAQWMGQFHSRFADLPASLRFEQLSQWDRPPVTESSVAAWVHVGLASVLLRMRRDDEARARWTMASKSAARSGPACRLEVLLLKAKLDTDEGQRLRAEACFDEAEALLERPELEPDERRCYQARILGQRAYHLTRSHAGSQVDLEGALALFETIDDEPFLPFVAFRKANGLAYCHWQLGDVERGIALARQAEQHAGDGGYVRF